MYKLYKKSERNDPLVGIDAGLSASDKNKAQRLQFPALHYHAVFKVYIFFDKEYISRAGCYSGGLDCGWHIILLTAKPRAIYGCGAAGGEGRVNLRR